MKNDEVTNEAVSLPKESSCIRSTKPSSPSKSDLTLRVTTLTLSTTIGGGFGGGGIISLDTTCSVASLISSRSCRLKIDLNRDGGTSTGCEVRYTETRSAEEVVL